MCTHYVKSYKGDWSQEEFRALLGYKHVNISAYGFKPPVAFEYQSSLPARRSVDWRDHGVVSAIKNQVCYKYSLLVLVVGS